MQLFNLGCIYIYKSTSAFFSVWYWLGGGFLNYKWAWSIDTFYLRMITNLRIFFIKKTLLLITIYGWLIDKFILHTISPGNYFLWY